MDGMMVGVLGWGGVGWSGKRLPSSFPLLSPSPSPVISSCVHPPSSVLRPPSSTPAYLMFMLCTMYDGSSIYTSYYPWDLSFTHYGVHLGREVHNVLKMYV